MVGGLWWHRPLLCAGLCHLDQYPHTYEDTISWLAERKPQHPKQTLAFGITKLIQTNLHVMIIGLCMINVADKQAVPHRQDVSLIAVGFGDLAGMMNPVHIRGDN